ncbi:MAG: LysR family transcriptional regulator [Paracoccaceae bacterium]|jgi:DNA-binding transcriptional LysR family regulator|tara:strand:+ start:190 stop:1068 length:879 start_codon:yes stop_codon:yes gene_type:complete
MGQMEDLKLYVQVVEQGSISKAASILRIAKSAVSRRISILEERYSSVLIDRTPGKWEITKVGLDLYQRSRALVAEFEEVNEDFTSLHAQISGPLNISIPRDFGLNYLRQKLFEFQGKYPNIKLSIDFDDRFVDLETENYDFAIRITAQADTKYISKRIGAIRRYLCASPEYLSLNGTPQNLEDLQAHSLLHYGNTKRGNWTFQTSDRKEKSIKFSPTISSNSGQFLGEAALNNIGISMLPDFIADKYIDTGQLKTILPQYSLSPYEIYLTHLGSRRLNRRMRAFSSALELDQ